MAPKKLVEKAEGEGKAKAKTKPKRCLGRGISDATDRSSAEHFKGKPENL